MNNLKFQKRNIGFTLIETLVAISILTIALTGPLAIIAQALRSSYYSRDEITAYYLAQEAIEYIRNKRDANGLKGANLVAPEDWLQGVAVDSDDPTSSLINPYLSTGESDQIKAVLIRSNDGYKLQRCAATCPPLKFNTSYSSATIEANTYALYGDNNADSDSIFTREVIFSEAPPYVDSNDPNATVVHPKDREVIVTVRVSWVSPAGTPSVSVREHLTNWQIERVPPETTE